MIIALQKQSIVLIVKAKIPTILKQSLILITHKNSGSNINKLCVKLYAAIKKSLIKFAYLQSVSN